MWQEAYEKLTPEQQTRVQRWLHLNHFIARVLGLSFETWVERFLGPAMAQPMDYGFMEACIPAFGGLQVSGQGESFTTALDPATAQTARVPLRARNNLGRLSPQTQDGLSGLLAEGAPARVVLLPADVAQLAKLFPKERALAKLDRARLRGIAWVREGDEVRLEAEDGAQLMSLSVLELGVILRKPLL